MLETPAKLAKSINLMLDTICQNDPKLYDFIVGYEADPDTLTLSRLIVRGFAKGTEKAMPQLQDLHRTISVYYARSLPMNRKGNTVFVATRVRTDNAVEYLCSVEGESSVFRSSALTFSRHAELVAIAQALGGRWVVNARQS